MALVVLLTASACSDGDSSASVPTSTTSGSDTVPTSEGVSTSTTGSDATSTTASTSTSVPVTTTTVPVLDELQLSAEGLGTALFGAEAESVVEYVDALLGSPSTDSGWIDPFAIGLACPGSEVRFVEWGGLRLFFSDQSAAASSVRHFASYTYEATFGGSVAYRLVTAEGIGLGATVRQLRDAYPGGALSTGDDLIGPRYEISAGFTAFVTEAVSTGIVRSFVGGFGCAD